MSEAEREMRAAMAAQFAPIEANIKSSIAAINAVLIQKPPRAPDGLSAATHAALTVQIPTPSATNAQVAEALDMTNLKPPGGISATMLSTLTGRGPKVEEQPASIVDRMQFVIERIAAQEASLARSRRFKP